MHSLIATGIQVLESEHYQGCYASARSEFFSTM